MFDWEEGESEAGKSDGCSLPIAGICGGFVRIVREQPADEPVPSHGGVFVVEGNEAGKEWSDVRLKIWFGSCGPAVR